MRPSLLEALHEYVAVEDLNGGNQYDCDNCRGKRDATRQIALKSLPPVLCMQLLRFVYDPFKGNKKKVSDPMEFPEVLHMGPLLWSADGSAEPKTRGLIERRLAL